MSRYKVLVDDNFHFMDESERYEAGVFSTVEEAITKCKSMIDADLKGYDRPNVSADQLYDLWMSFGSDPFIVPANKDEEPPKFSASKYVKERSQVLAHPER